jgi:dTDP-4-amino-4,6-dideoxygalactose transaminase
MGRLPALPVSERLCAESLSLPCFPELTDDEVAHVVAAVRASVRALD